MTLDVKYFELKKDIAYTLRRIWEKAEAHENPSVCIFDNEQLEVELNRLCSIAETLRKCEMNLNTIQKTREVKNERAN